MCKFCDYDNSEDCCIFEDGLTGEPYYNHRTDEWDPVDQDFIYEKIYIGYCPWCGAKLKEAYK